MDSRVSRAALVLFEAYAANDGLAWPAPSLP